MWTFVGVCVCCLFREAGPLFGPLSTGYVIFLLFYCYWNSSIIFSAIFYIIYLKSLTEGPCFSLRITYYRFCGRYHIHCLMTVIWEDILTTCEHIQGSPTQQLNQSSLVKNVTWLRKGQGFNRRARPKAGQVSQPIRMSSDPHNYYHIP